MTRHLSERGICRIHHLSPSLKCPFIIHQSLGGGNGLLHRSQYRCDLGVLVVAESGRDLRRVNRDYCFGEFVRIADHDIQLLTGYGLGTDNMQAKCYCDGGEEEADASHGDQQEILL